MSDERGKGSRAAVRHLERVADIIRDRGGLHGDAVEQHETLAGLWAQYLGAREGWTLTASDAAFMLLLMKVSRVFAGGLREQHVEDIAGYAAIVMAAFESDEDMNRIVEELLEERPAAVHRATQAEVDAAGPIDGPFGPARAAALKAPRGVE